MKDMMSQAIGRVAGVVNEFPWEHRHCYGMWLAQSYHMVKYTTRLASLTAGATPLEQEDLHMSGIRHLQEEIHHEVMAERDLSQLGFRVEQFPHLLETKLLVQSQYYYIEFAPIAHYGFVLFLEGLAAAVGPQVASRIVQAYGVKACQFTVVHAELDQKHAPAISSMIEKHTQGGYERRLVQENLEQTSELYLRMMRECASAGALGRLVQSA